MTRLVCSKYERIMNKPSKGVVFIRMNLSFTLVVLPKMFRIVADGFLWRSQL